MCTQGSTCHETDGRSRQQQDFHLTHNSRHPCYYGKYRWHPSLRFIYWICHFTSQVVTRWSPGCFLIETTGCFTFTCGCWLLQMAFGCATLWKHRSLINQIQPYLTSHEHTRWLPVVFVQTNWFFPSIFCFLLSICYCQNMFPTSAECKEQYFLEL